MPNHRTAVRFAVGATTTQPDLGVIAPFAPVPLGSLVGAHGSISKISINTLGSGIRGRQPRSLPAFAMLPTRIIAVYGTCWPVPRTI